ncbi:MAG: glycosyltransferase [Planctomycetales bacterium]
MIPRFSIVMTVFETLEFLPRALACVMDQQYQEWELLVISDGPASSERYDPRKMLRPLRKTFPGRRIEFWELPRREGCWGNPARQYGWQQARGNYVCWVNHDNLIFPGYLQGHAVNIAAQPGCASVVDIHLWQQERFVGRYPRGYRKGKIDLLCYALPLERVQETDAFGERMHRVYAADGMVFEECAAGLAIQHRHEALGVHF